MDLTKLYYRDDATKWAHPELVAIYEEMSHQEVVLDIIFNDEVDIKEKQALVKELDEMYNVPPAEDQRTRMFEVMVPGCVEEPDAPLVPMTYALPENPKRKMPCIINIAGGGLFFCSTVPSAVDLADTYGCVGVELKYRILPNGDNYPAQINDCHAVYSYILEHAEEMHVNVNKIIVIGMSSGGLLALSLCHRLKRYGIRPRGCCVNVPTLDDRLIYSSSKIFGNGWARDQSHAMFRNYLGFLDGSSAATPEMAANHATVEDCVGLPPTMIHAHANDIYFGPCMDYYNKLNAAGVHCGLHVWPGSNHDSIFTAACTYRGDSEYPYANVYADVMEFEIKDLIRYDHSHQWVASEIED